MRAPTDRELGVFDALVRHARPLILPEFSADSCIASTRIGLDALAYFGVQAREYCMMTMAFNPEAAELLAEGLDLMQIQDRIIDGGDDPAGPWSVGVGGAVPVPGVPRVGHLIIGSPETGLIADLSIDQGARPERRIHLEPFFTRITQPDDWFDDPKGVTVVQRGGVILILDRSGAPEPPIYQQSVNWKRRSARTGRQGVFKRVTGQVIRAIKADLGE